MGTRKETLNWYGQTERERLGDILSKVTDQLYYSEKEGEGENIIKDSEVGFGPLSGMFSAHHKHPNADWFVLSCDLPLMDLAHLEQIVAEFKKQQKSTSFESRYDGENEPLCSIYKAEDLAKIPAFFADKDADHRPRYFFKSLTDQSLIIPNTADAVDNCNTPGDKLDIEVRLKVGRGKINLKLEHYAQLEAAIGSTQQDWMSYSRTAYGLWEELKMKYKLKSIDPKVLRPVINDELVNWSAQIKEGDLVSFLPPFAGG